MHIDNGDLALVAMGAGSALERDHLAGCSHCTAEVRSLGAVAEIMTMGGPMPDRAPDHVWACITAAVSADAPLVSVQDDVDAELAHDGLPADQALSNQAAQDKSSAVVVGSRRERRRSDRVLRRSWSVGLLAAAAVGAGVMWIGTSVISDATATDTDTDTDFLTMATAELDALEDSVKPGAAEVTQREGSRVLRVDTTNLPEVADGYLQVWLLGDDDAGMVTVGALSRSGEEFVLPDGLSLETFAMVDVSVERYDGNPEHSGESLWRGPLNNVT